MSTGKLVKKIVDIKREAFNKSITLNAKAGGDLSIPFTIPNGYTYFGINRANPSSAMAIIGNTYIDGNNIKTTIYNNDSQQRTFTIYVDILSVK